MDDVSDSLLDSAGENRGGMPVFVPIALALIGIALGGVALYFTLTGGKEDELTARLSESGNQVAQLEKRITELNAQNEKLRHDYELLGRKMDSSINTITGQVQKALNDVGMALNQTNQKVSANTEGITKVVEALNSGQVRPSASSRPSVASSGAGPASQPNEAASVAEPEDAEPGYRMHVIASGESFASVAKKYGVPLQKVLEANPDDDPHRLAIGQRIRVPLPNNE